MVATRLIADARALCSPKEFFLQFRNVMLDRFSFSEDEMDARDERKDAVSAIARVADTKQAWDRKFLSAARKGI